MTLAQRLYEGIDLPGEGSVGLITYMRTDSVTIADTALREIAELVKTEYGEALHAGRAPPVQDAVAQRPGGARGGPTDERDALARARRGRARPRPAPPLHADLAAHDGHADGRGAVPPGRGRHRGRRGRRRRYGLRATGQTMIFDGFIRVYQEGRDEGPDEDAERMLPELTAEQLAADARGRARAALHPAPAALLGGVAREDAGGAGDRPAVDLRLDHRHDPAPSST